MNVSVVIPWRNGCPHRESALTWVQARFAWDHPDWQVVLGESPDGPFNRSAAILDGARRCDGDVILVADGDVWCDTVNAVQVARDAGWAVPHQLIHRLSPESTLLVLGGADWRGLPLSTDNRQDSKPYRGNATGTLVAVRRDVLLDVPPDVRFVGWGREDNAWGRALTVLVGEPWRGSEDLVHLWHPPQERPNRVQANPESEQLWHRYRTAGLREIRELVEESKEA